MAVFWIRDVLWQALQESVRTLRRHLGKELLLGLIVLVLAWLRHEDEAFVDGLRESFILLVQAALIYFSGVFLWQVLLAPVQFKRELAEDKVLQVQSAPAVSSADQRIAFKNRLIWLYEQGQLLLQQDPLGIAWTDAFGDETEWAADAEAFLLAALGEGEASHFHHRVGAANDVELWVHQGVNHLHELMTKSDTLTIRPDFDPTEWQACPHAASGTARARMSA